MHFVPLEGRNVSGEVGGYLSNGACSVSDCLAFLVACESAAGQYDDQYATIAEQGLLH